MLLIGMTGLAGSGKDTAASFLVKNHGFTSLAFADLMKRMVKEAFDFTETQLWGPSECRNAVDGRYGDLTPRKALQLLGTEWGRRCWPNVWVDYVMRTIQELRQGGLTYDRLMGVVDYGTGSPKGIVITDVRFDNEAEAIHRMGGIVVKILRSVQPLTGEASAHSSEAGVSYRLVDWRVNNDGTLEQLARSMRALAGESSST